MKSSPTVGSSNPAISFRIVLFPQPEGPSNEKNSPLQMLRSMVLRAYDPIVVLADPIQLDLNLRWTAVVGHGLFLNRLFRADQDGLPTTDDECRQHDHNGHRKYK